MTFVPYQQQFKPVLPKENVYTKHEMYPSYPSEVTAFYEYQTHTRERTPTYAISQSHRLLPLGMKYNYKMADSQNMHER